MTTPITHYTQVENSTDYYTYYSEPGEYEISIEGWYNYFKCYDSEIRKPDVRQINEVLTEVIQVSSLITKFGGIQWNGTFAYCSKLTNIPYGLFDKNTKVTNFNNTFYGCSSLTSIPSGLFDKNAGITSFDSTFANCSALTSIPSGLFDKNTKATYFNYAFENCSNLIGETPYTLSSDSKRIKLWDRDETNGFVKPTSTYRAFYNCLGLIDYKDIPGEWK